jgi:transposase
MLYVGVDIHWRMSSVCILDSAGRLVKEQQIDGDWEDLVAFLGTLPKPWKVCFEASCGYGHVYDRLKDMAQEIVVGHPGGMRLIYRTKRKNDRIDAAKLARLLLLDAVPRVHVPAAEMRAWRSLIEFRRGLVDKRVRCKNGIRAMLRGQGIRMGRGLWTKKGLADLRTLPLSGLTAVQRTMLLRELAELNGEIHVVTKELDKQARRHPGVAVLRTIPGIGARTAEAVVAYIDQPKRFARNRQIGAYFGLVPCQDASAGVERLGHITRQGPATVRKYITEAAWQVVRRSPSMKARFAKWQNGRPERKKIAVVAVAHHLLRCMLAMLNTGEAWREAAA